jgi:ActR/RegA family two-component response regulator
MTQMKLLLVDDESDFRNTLLKRMQRRNVMCRASTAGKRHWRGSMHTTST